MSSDEGDSMKRHFLRLLNGAFRKQGFNFIELLGRFWAIICQILLESHSKRESRYLYGAGENSTNARLFWPCMQPEC